MILSLIFALLLQTPAPGQKIVVGLKDGEELTLQDPEFTGFIDGRSGDAVLIYHQADFHGEMPLKTIARIEFLPYKKGKPFSLTVTLRTGQTLQVESERRDFVSIRGKTDFGIVTIKQPDPESNPVEITTRKPNRKKDLTIQYLEIPSS